MARIELSKPAIQAALRDAGDERVILRDSKVPGLSAIITNRQVRLEFSYRPRGRTAEGARWPMRYVSLGQWPHTSLSDARAEAQKLKLAVADGFDPAAERDLRREARLEQRKSDITVSKAVDLHVLHAQRLSSSSSPDGAALARAIDKLGMEPSFSESRAGDAPHGLRSYPRQAPRHRPRAHRQRAAVFCGRSASRLNRCRSVGEAAPSTPAGHGNCD